MLDTILHKAINPALKLLPLRMDSEKARVEMLAAGLQESRFEHRYQIVRNDPYAKGPARGFWQNERSGVFAVMTNRATADYARDLCKACGVPFDSPLVHARIEFDDVLAAGLARLLLWADPKPLPEVDDTEGAWLCYLRCWRPGKPRRETWDEFHAQARAQVMA